MYMELNPSALGFNYHVYGVNPSALGFNYHIHPGGFFDPPTHWDRKLVVSLNVFIQIQALHPMEQLLQLHV